MTIWMIWATQEGITWLVSAWDDDSQGDNFEGWLKEVEQARSDYGADNVRVLRTQVDFDAVVAAFEAPEVANDGIKEAK